MLLVHVHVCFVYTLEHMYTCALSLNPCTCTCTFLSFWMPAFSFVYMYPLLPPSLPPSLQDPTLQQFFSLCEQLETKGGPLDTQMQESLQVRGGREREREKEREVYFRLFLQQMANLELGVVIQFLPVVLTQLFRLLSTSSKDLEQLKAEVVR